MADQGDAQFFDLLNSSMNYIEPASRPREDPRSLAPVQQEGLSNRKPLEKDLYEDTLCALELLDLTSVSLSPSIQTHLTSEITSSLPALKLSEIVQETNAILNRFFPNSPARGTEAFHYSYLPSSPLEDSVEVTCPKQAIVAVVNADPLDIALTCFGPPVKVSDAKSKLPGEKPVLVLNLADANQPGGRWLKGPITQEANFYYRSSLSRTLKPKFYPLPPLGLIYSPRVVVFRESARPGEPEKKAFALMDITAPKSLPVVSMISVAAVEKPSLIKVPTISSTLPNIIESGGFAGVQAFKNGQTQKIYSNSSQYIRMRTKIMQILRISAIRGHRRIILGALGCDASKNPRDIVAGMFREVLQEEWQEKGWWESIVFAVVDPKPSKKKGSFATFHEALHGLRI
ncbi:hypothetical protein MMC10_006752 [Thelotrema lepadinum]|nr:hypothetical protein [Thelotrema lepadinum]